MSEQVKVSILIPVYNRAKFLPACLDSVLKQTLKEIEIIAVDDKSDRDNSLEILKAYAERDPRVKVVAHEKNGGILAARCSGIRAASGEFVICLDADDFLDRDIARAAYAKAKKTGADIVHFQTHVTNEQGKVTRDAKSVHNKMNPYPHALLGKDVFEGAFSKRLFRWNIVGKMISTEVAKKAADDLLPGYYIMAEDFCFCSHMLFHAKHYEPLMRNGYTYILDVGVSAYGSSSRSDFQRKCTAFTALNAVRSFLQKYEVWEKYRGDFEKQENDLIGDLADRWVNRVLPADRKYCTKYMLEHYDANAILRGLANYFPYLQDAQCFAMHLPESFLPTEHGPLTPPKRIGIHVDDKTTDLTRQLMNLAKKLTADGIQAEIITPDSLGATATDGNGAAYAKRIKNWQSIVREKQFDCIVYEEPRNTLFFWDLLAIREAGARVMFVPRTNFNGAGSMHVADFIVRKKILKYADLILCLSDRERQSYVKQGIRTAILPVDPMEIPVGNDNKNIVWCGDGGNISNLSLVAATFAKLMTDLPQDAKLVLCSPHLPNEIKRQLYGFADMLGFQGRYEVQDANHLAEFLPTAKILLIEDGDTELANHAALFRHGKTIVCSDTPEETIRRIHDGQCFQYENHASWDDVVKAWSAPIEETDHSDSDDLLMQLYNSAMNYEQYAMEPPIQGDAFFPLYLDIDRQVAKLLKPGTKLRHYALAGTRRVMKKIFK